MKTELLDKANQLRNDVEKMKKIVKESLVEKHWITIIAPNNRGLAISGRLQNELVDWLSKKIEEYEKEFEEL